MSLLEEKKHQLDDLKQQADQTLSRPTTSTKERKPLDSLENNTNRLKKQLSFSQLDINNPTSKFRFLDFYFIKNSSSGD
jgi:hypothetical protein